MTQVYYNSWGFIEHGSKVSSVVQILKNYASHAEPLEIAQKSLTDLHSPQNGVAHLLVVFESPFKGKPWYTIYAYHSYQGHLKSQIPTRIPVKEFDHWRTTVWAKQRKLPMPLTHETKARSREKKVAFVPVVSSVQASQQKSKSLSRSNRTFVPWATAAPAVKTTSKQQEQKKRMHSLDQQRWSHGFNAQVDAQMPNFKNSPYRSELISEVNQNLISNTFHKKIKNLGAGGFGNVAIYKSDSHDVPIHERYVIVKNMLKSAIGLTEFLNEFYINTRVRGKNDINPFVCQLLGVYFTVTHAHLVWAFPRSSKEGLNISIGLQYTSLRRFLILNDSDVDWIQNDNLRVALAYRIVRAVQRLHTAGFAHRDLKPENLLVLSMFDSLTPEEVTTLLPKKHITLDMKWKYQDQTPDCDYVRFIDFAFSCHLSVKGHCRYLYGETAHYAPPEPKEKYDAFRADLWALGLTVFEVLYPGGFALEPFATMKQHPSVVRRLWNLTGISLPALLDLDPQRRRLV
jgi:hypothetical protein